VARSTIQDNLNRAQAAGLAWPLDPDLSDEILERRLFGRPATKSFRHRAEPDWAALASELKRPGVNLTVLWEECREIHPEGYRYSRFCDLFREFERRLSPVMRQNHVAGDKVFVDYSGKSRAFRRSVRCIQLHVRGSNLDSIIAGLARSACSYVRILSGRAKADCSR
jgi:transposase